jgi:hypothetical protein
MIDEIVSPYLEIMHYCGQFKIMGNSLHSSLAVRMHNTLLVLLASIHTLILATRHHSKC